MMAPVTAAILLITGIASLLAFRNDRLRERLMFNPRAILAERQFERLVTSGFIHADWMHLLFNAYSFYAFGELIEAFHGAGTLLLVYFSSIVGGSLLSLLIHRHHDYRALGASGGVCGVIFACIFLLPGTDVQLVLVPIPIPAVVYAVGFLVISFVGTRREADNIGHDAHLGGAIIGLLTATALYPSLVMASPRMFAAVLGLSTLILAVMVLDPHRLLERRFQPGPRPTGNVRYRRYDEARDRNAKLAEIDRLLDKIADRGLHSLSKGEREKLDRLSKEVGGGR